MNKGNAIAVWYLVQFDVPLEIFLLANMRSSDAPKQLTIQLGQQSNWRIDLLGEEKMRVTFMSNGIVASYPDHPVPLGILNLPKVTNSNYAPQYEIPYMIVNDRGPSHGLLTIQLSAKMK